MNSRTTCDEIVQCVLQKFQYELRGLRGGWLSRTFMGNPPTEGFARQLSELDDRGRMTGSVRGVWRITHTEISALPTSYAIPAIGQRSGMYYDRGAFDFVVAADLNSVVVGWQVGPRFGRGFRYQVIAGNGPIKLQLADTLWKS